MEHLFHIRHSTNLSVSKSQQDSYQLLSKSWPVSRFVIQGNLSYFDAASKTTRTFPGLLGFSTAWCGRYHALEVVFLWFPRCQFLSMSFTDITVNHVAVLSCQLWILLKFPFRGMETRNSHNTIVEQTWLPFPQQRCFVVAFLVCMCVCWSPLLAAKGWITKGAAQRDRPNAYERRPWMPPNGHEWSRSTAAKPDVFYLGKGQTTTPGTLCPTPYE